MNGKYSYVKEYNIMIYGYINCPNIIVAAMVFISITLCAVLYISWVLNQINDRLFSSCPMYLYCMIFNIVETFSCLLYTINHDYVHVFEYAIGDTTIPIKLRSLETGNKLDVYSNHAAYLSPSESAYGLFLQRYFILTSHYIHNP